jgi:hypothetical protein
MIKKLFKILDKWIWRKIFDISFNIFIVWIILLVIYMIFINWTQVWIDNPTKQSIFIKINSDWIEKEIPAKTYLRFSINNWENEIFLNWKSVWKINKEFFSDTSYFINPTLTPYISEYTLYIAKEINRWMQINNEKLPNNTIKILDKEIVWPFKEYEWLYINWTWDYWFGDMLNKTDEEIEWPESQQYKIKEKLYRLDDFIDMYNKKYVEQK